MRQIALVRRAPFGINAFGIFGQRDLILGFVAAATPFLFPLLPLLAGLLPLLFRTHRIGFIQLRCRGAAKLFFEFLDPLVRCFELLLRRLDLLLL